jgi:putative nucleotidyltransferase with HDIG domain
MGSGAAERRVHTLKLDWLRNMAVASNYRELSAAVENLAAGLAGPGATATLYEYDFQGWCLRCHCEQLPLDNATLAGRCALDGEVQREEAPPQVAVPVRRFGSLAGVLVVQGGTGHPPLDELLQLAEGFALVMEPQRELDRARQALSGFQELAVAAVESLPECYTGHSAAVCQLTADLAEYLDLSQQARQRLWNAALYHDIGKLLLHGTLPAEMELRHAEAGADFLEQKAALTDVAALVRTHHERYDGTGPAGLSGEQCSTEQYILILAEAFDEFLSLNPHVDFGVKVGVFMKEKGRFHHPDVLDSLAGLIESGRLDRLR